MEQQAKSPKKQKKQAQSYDDLKTEHARLCFELGERIVQMNFVQQTIQELVAQINEVGSKASKLPKLKEHS